MKRFLVRVGVFVSLQLLILLVVMNYGSRDSTSNEYMYCLKDKYELLKTTPGPRIILVGGSSLAFGLQSPVIQDNLKRNPINLGLHGRLGMHVLLRMVREQVRPGDLIVLSPEHQALFENSRCTRELAIETIQLWPGCSRFLQPDFDRPLETEIKSSSRLREIGRCVVASVKRFQKRSQGNESRLYRRRGFNQFGDHIAHYKVAAPESFDHRFCSIKPGVFREVADEFNRFSEFCESKHAKVLFVHCPVNQEISRQNQETLEEMDKLIKSKIRIPIMTSWNSLLLDDDQFFDSQYHLTEAGAQRRTDSLCQVLAPVFR